MGIVKHNENRIDEMSLIMDELHNYVPLVTQDFSHVLPDGSVWEDNSDFFHRILMGGDQLTVARAFLFGVTMIRVRNDLKE